MLKVTNETHSFEVTIFAPKIRSGSNHQLKDKGDPSIISQILPTRVGVKFLQSSLSQTEKVYQYREYLKSFCEEEKLQKFNQRRTVNMKYTSKVLEKNYQSLHNLQFQVNESQKNEALAFIENYESKYILNGFALELAYQNLLKATCNSLQINNKELITKVAQQFFYFITSNYKSLQYPEEGQFIDFGDSESDLVEIFKENRNRKQQNGSKSSEEGEENEFLKEQSRRETQSIGSITQIGEIKRESLGEEKKQPFGFLNDFEQQKIIVGQSNLSQGNQTRSRDTTLNNIETKSEESTLKTCNIIKEDANSSEHNQENLQKNLSPSIKKKRTNNFYNLPRYFMMLILEFLSVENLELLEVPKGLISQVNKVRLNLRSIGKKTGSSRSNFYNHTHYSCLFFLHLQKPSEDSPYYNLLQAVFEIEDLKSEFGIATVNCTKLIISSIITQQLQIILKHPLTEYIINNQKLFNLEKTKIDYVKRVNAGISKLNSGIPLSRF